MALFLAISALSFCPQTPALSAAGRASTPMMALDSTLGRRSAILSAAAAAALPLAARAEIFQGGTSLGRDDLFDKDYSAGTEDALAKIAAKNAKALEEEKKKKLAEYSKAGDKDEKANALAPLIVGGFGLASVVLSLPFFYKNLARLYLRFASVVDKSITEDQYKK